MVKSLRVGVGIVGIAAVALILGVAFLILWGGADAAIRVVSSGRVYSKATVDAVPSARAAVVLGCSRTLRGGLGNLYCQHRIRATRRLPRPRIWNQRHRL